MRAAKAGSRSHESFDRLARLLVHDDEDGASALAHDELDVVHSWRVRPSRSLRHRLESLELGDNKIKDSGASALAKSKTLKSLTSLGLACSPGCHSNR